MFLKFTIFAALAAFTLMGADAPKGIAQPATAPSINSAKLWRLLAQAQQLRQQAQQTTQAKAAEKADEAVAAEQQHLTELCGADFVLGYQTDQKSENVGDLICVAKPAVEKPAEAKKEK